RRSPDLLEQPRFEREQPLLRPENLLLPLLQLRGDVAFRVGERLSALEVRGDAVEVGPGDFQVVPEDLVETDLQRADTGPFALARLPPRNPVHGAVTDRAQLVELRIVPRPDDPTFGGNGWRLVRDRRGDEVDELLQRIEPVAVLTKQSAGGGTQQVGELRQRCERSADGEEIPGRAAGGRDLHRQPLEVADLLEPYADLSPQLRIVDQLLDRGQPPLDGIARQQWREKPAAAEASH